MDHREFVGEGTQSRRRFLRSAAAGAAGAGGLAGMASLAHAAPRDAATKRSGRPTFRDLGWAWEGQGIDPKVPPSIYGLGQGARYFGLSRANFLFHPNDVHALELLKDYDEVTCDISKWGWEWNADGRPACKATSDPATVQAEGEKVARLARQFSNVTGVYGDDLLGLMKQFTYGAKEFGGIRSAIRDANPALKLWSVVYTHEFAQAEFWTSMRPHIDVVTLWIWNSDDLGHMPEYVDQCRRLFPDKPIVMGVYLRDYTKVAPIPVDLVKRQMEGIADLVGRGTLAGYSILGAVLIDGHRPQADAVRDFIAAQSEK
jgi:hypothetical protein